MMGCSCFLHRKIPSFYMVDELELQNFLTFTQGTDVRKMNFSKKVGEESLEKDRRDH